MKKIKFILLGLFLSSLTYANNDGPVVGYFGISTEDPLTVLNAANRLNKDCPSAGRFTLLANTFDADDESTHLFVGTFANNAEFMDYWNGLSSCDGWAKYFSKTNPVVNATFNSMGIPLMGGGDQLKDSVFQAFNISVTDPAKFAGAYAQLMPALAAEGICPSSWGLVAIGAGTNPSWGTHLTFCGYPDMKTYLEVSHRNAKSPSPAFINFQSKVQGVVTIERVSMSTVVARFD